MIKTFLVCSLNGRMHNVLFLLQSLKSYTDWRLCLVLQMYPSNEIEFIKTHAEQMFPDRLVVYESNEMTGPHLARCKALDECVSDVWCILDDDMYAVDGYTNYDKMAEIVFENKKIGILSSNWRKTEDMLRRQVLLSDNMKKQNIVYTGGGMMIRQDVAEIIKAIPRVQYLFDNPLWSIYSYVNGYDNYRYMGSAAVHQICTKGGRRKWITESNRKKNLPPEEWLRTRRGKGKEGGFDEYLICDSSDITELAHKLHKDNLK